MPASTMSRRTVIRVGVASAAALLLKLSPLRATDSPLRVRPDVSTPDGEAMLGIYARAIATMKQKPAYEPTSWWFQANIHSLACHPQSRNPCGPENNPIWGTFRPSDLDAIFTPALDSDQATRERLVRLRKLALDSPQGAQDPLGQNRVWVTCPHHTPDETFLVWHRLYLAIFEQTVERVAREVGSLSPDGRFALPYWNYLAHPELPEPFRLPGDDSNPLYLAFRNPEANNGDPIIDDLALEGTGEVAEGGWPVASQRRSLLGAKEFANVLETAPHDPVHGRVGGWMGGVTRSARDPVFWLHHAQIDRLWESWRIGVGGMDPSDSTPQGKAWNDAVLRFVSALDEADTRKARDVLDAGTLGYRYDRLEPVSAVIAAGPGVATTAETSARAQTIAAAETPVVVSTETVHVPLMATAPAASAEPIGKTPGQVVLRIIGVRASVDPETDYDVFLQPKNGAGEPSGRPVARINLFGRVHDIPGHEAEAAMPISPGKTLAIPLTQSLATAGVSELRPDDLVVTIRPNGTPAGDIIIERIELVAE